MEIVAPVTVFSGFNLDLNERRNSLAAMGKPFIERRAGAAGKALCLALACAAAGWSGTVSACVFLAPTYVFGDPPAGMTDPAEIEAWKDEQVRQSKAVALLGFEEQWRAYKADLAVEAERGSGFDGERLSRVLADALVPPILPQSASRTDCGDLLGPELADPAGYLDLYVGRSEPELAGFLIELGILQDEGELELMPPRALRDLANNFGCTDEARDRVRRRLHEEFGQAELEHIWSAVHRHGFDRASVEEEAERDYWSGPRPHRLLRFAAGRSGALIFSDRASPAFDAGTSRLILEGQAGDKDALHRFFESDPVAVRVVDTIERELAGVSVERCPQTAAQIAALAAELRPQIEARRRPRRPVPDIEPNPRR